jgi:hypothetical protein
MVFLSYFLFKKYYITWFIISNHYKLNVLIYYRLLIVCNTSCLIWTTIWWTTMLCRVHSLFHRISKKHYHLNFSLFIEYIVTYYCPFSFLLRLYIIEVFYCFLILIMNVQTYLVKKPELLLTSNTPLL